MTLVTGKSYFSPNRTWNMELELILTIYIIVIKTKIINSSEPRIRELIIVLVVNMSFHLLFCRIKGLTLFQMP